MARVFTKDLVRSSGSKWGELRLDIVPGTQDIANNKTPITYELYVQRTATTFGGYWSNNTNTASLTINGTAITVSNFTYDFRTVYKKSLKTGSMTITHDADGKKSVPTSASVTFAGEAPSGSGSGSLALTTIPRASSFTLSGSTQTGSAVTVTITKAATAFRHRVRWRIGSGAWTTTSTAADTTASVTVPHTAIPNSTSATVTIAVQTLSAASGGTEIGAEQTKTRTLTVPDTIVPSFTTVTHSEYVSAINTAIGEYVQNKTRLSLAITGASAGSGASISSYKITVDGQTAAAQSGTTEVIKSSGSLNIVGTVTDSRSRSVSKTVQISVLPYHDPTLESIGLTRATSAGVQDPFGTYARLNIKAKVASLNSKNTATYRVRSRLASSTTWTTKTAATAIGISASVSNTYSGYTVTNEYQFEVLMTDKLGSQTIVNDLLFLSTGGVPFFVGYEGNASSFGKIPTHGSTYDLEIGDKGLRVDGPIIDKNGAELLASIYPVGSIYINVVNTNPGTLFGGTWVAFGAGRTLVGVDTAQTEFNTVQKTGGHKSLQSHTHTVTVASGGAHTHTVSGTAASAGAHTHDVESRSVYAGGDTYGALTWIGNSALRGTAIKSAGAHTHTVSGTAASAGAHSHTATAASSGSGDAQNLQPYITVYMWRRTA